MRKKDGFVLLGVLLLVFVLVTQIKIQTVEEHYQEDSNVTADGIGTVTLAIRCDTLLDNYDLLESNLRDEAYVPSDGVILEETEYVLYSEDTVFDVLLRAVKENQIAMEYQGGDQNAYGSVYIQGINYLYEFSAGPLSGWMYKVNDEIPDMGCSNYLLEDGDRIAFLYTCDLGRDLGKD